MQYFVRSTEPPPFTASLPLRGRWKRAILLSTFKKCKRSKFDHRTGRDDESQEEARRHKEVVIEGRKEGGKEGRKRKKDGECAVKTEKMVGRKGRVRYTCKIAEATPNP